MTTRSVARVERRRSRLRYLRAIGTDKRFTASAVIATDARPRIRPRAHSVAVPRQGAGAHRSPSGAALAPRARLIFRVDSRTPVEPNPTGSRFSGLGAATGNG